MRALVSRVDEGRLVIASARDEERGAAHQRRGRRPPRTRAAERACVSAVVSLHAFLWSADLQTRSRAAVAAAPDLAGRTLRGARPRRVQARRVRAVPAHGRRARRRRPPCRRCASPICVRRRSKPSCVPSSCKLGDEIGVLTFVRDLKDPAALAATLADLPGVRVFDQVRFLDETYARFRVQTLEAIGIGHRADHPDPVRPLPPAAPGAGAPGAARARRAPRRSACSAPPASTTNLLHVLSLLHGAEHGRRLQRLPGRVRPTSATSARRR